VVVLVITTSYMVFTSGRYVPAMALITASVDRGTAALHERQFGDPAIRRGAARPPLLRCW